MIRSGHIAQMLNHWLMSKPNAYVGSDYGPDIQALFLKPQNSGAANQFIQKMYKDLPILRQIPANQISIYNIAQGFEQTHLILRIGDVKIDLNTVRDQIKD